MKKFAYDYISSLWKFCCCMPKTYFRCVCSIRSMFIISSVMFLLINAAILNICNLSMFIPTTSSIHNEKNMISLQYVEDHTKSYLNDYAEFSQTLRDELYNCGFFNSFSFTTYNTPLLECFSKKGYTFARNYPYKDVFLGLKLENMGAVLFTTRGSATNGIVSDNVVMYYNNQSDVYPHPFLGFNVYKPKIIQVLFTEATRFTQILWNVRIPIGMEMFLDDAGYFEGLETWGVEKANFVEILSHYQEGYNQYDLTVRSPIRDQFTNAYLGTVFLAVNMNLLNEFLEDIKINNAIISLVNFKNDHIIASTSEDVVLVEKKEGRYHHITAHRSSFKPLAESYLKIRECEDVNKEYNDGKTIGGYQVQVRRFEVQGMDVVAIVQIPTSVMYQSVIVSSVVYFSISVLVLIVATLMSCFCGLCVTYPLSRVITKMEYIKEMELDRINVGKVKNPLVEVRRIEESLEFTVAKLREYRAFLPVHVLGADFDDDFSYHDDETTSTSNMSISQERSEKEDHDDSSSSISEDYKSGTGTSTRISVISATDDSLTGNASVGSLGGGAHSIGLLRNKFGLGYRKKGMCIAVVEFPVGELKKYYNSILALHKPGIVYQFNFDSIVMYIMKTDLLRRITLQLLDLYEEEEKDIQLNKKKDKMFRSGSSHDGVNSSSEKGLTHSQGSVSDLLIKSDQQVRNEYHNLNRGRFFVSAGEGIYGNLGNHSIKKFAVGGDVMNKMNYIRMGTPNYVHFVVCETVKKVLRKDIVTRLVDVNIHEVGRKAEFGSGQEWMYEMKEIQEIRRWNTFNEAVELLQKEEFQKSRELFQRYLKEENNGDDEVAKNWILRINEQFQPDQTVVLKDDEVTEDFYDEENNGKEEEEEEDPLLLELEKKGKLKRVDIREIEGENGVQKNE